MRIARRDAPRIALRKNRPAYAGRSPGSSYRHLEAEAAADDCTAADFETLRRVAEVGVAVEDPTAFEEVVEIAAIFVEADQGPPIAEGHLVALAEHRVVNLVGFGVVLDAAVKRGAEAELIPQVCGNAELREDEIELPIRVGTIDRAHPGQHFDIDPIPFEHAQHKCEV